MQGCHNTHPALPSLLQGLQLPTTLLPPLLHARDYFLLMPPDASGWEQTMPLGWGLGKGRRGGGMTNLLSGKIAPLNN